jgi:aminoglycoside 3-N-acetyltransferase I
MSVKVCHLTPDDIGLMQGLLATFGKAFNEVETYSGNKPNGEYLAQLKRSGATNEASNRQ